MTSQYTGTLLATALCALLVLPEPAQGSLALTLQPSDDGLSYRIFAVWDRLDPDDASQFNPTAAPHSYRGHVPYRANPLTGLETDVQTPIPPGVFIWTTGYRSPIVNYVNDYRAFYGSAGPLDETFLLSTTLPSLLPAIAGSHGGDNFYLWHAPGSTTTLPSSGSGSWVYPLPTSGLATTFSTLFNVGSYVSNSFTIDVLTTPFDTAGDAASVIATVLTTTGDLLEDPLVADKAKDKLEKVQEKLDEALLELALDDVKRALKKIADAVKKLAEAEEEGAVVDELIVLLHDAANTLVSDAIEAAADTIGVYQPELDKAGDEMAEAEEELAKGNPDKAIKHYAKAGEKAKKATSLEGLAHTVKDLIDGADGYPADLVDPIVDSAWIQALAAIMEAWDGDPDELAKAWEKGAEAEDEMEKDPPHAEHAIKKLADAIEHARKATEG